MISRRARVRGCLLAGAVGDALGAGVEFDSITEIRRAHGPAGVVDFVPAHGRDGGAITDDTQMTLFTAEGILTAIGAHDGSVDPGTVAADLDAMGRHVWSAYQRWLSTQDSGIETHTGSGSWLLDEPALRHRRAPGNTCLSALRGGRPGSPAARINDSKGCGGVMRVAPAGLVGLRDPFEVAVTCAALTHTHPSGYLPAGVLAFVVDRLIEGAALPDALHEAVGVLRRWDGHEETLDALHAALSLAKRGRPDPESIERLGGGWTGEEAMAIAVACALVADDLADGLRLAVNHSGDSDSTGAICGNLLGALLGEDAISLRWLEHLEARDVIERVADELSAATVPARRSD